MIYYLIVGGLIAGIYEFVILFPPNFLYESSLYGYIGIPDVLVIGLIYGLSANMILSWLTFVVLGSFIGVLVFKIKSRLVKK